MGPKKKRNEFYNFMMERKPHIEKQLGRNVTMAELTEMVGNEWQNMPESERAKYRARKGGKSKEKDLWHTYDSWGIPLAAIQQEEEAKRHKMQNMCKEISETVNRAMSANALQKKSFFIITTSYYVRTICGDCVPAELGLLQFSFESGIMKELSYIFQCNLPRGYRYEAVVHTEKTHNLPFTNPQATSGYKWAFQDIVNFVGKEGTKVPPLYTIEEEQEHTETILQKLDGGGDEYFKIYSIEQLFQEIYNSLFPDYHIPKSIAKDKILNCGMDFHPNIPCQWHQENKPDFGKYCAIGCCRRYVFMMCDNMNLSEIFGINLKEGHHLPRASVSQGIVINHPRNRAQMHSKTRIPRDMQHKFEKSKPQSESTGSAVNENGSSSDEENLAKKWTYGSDFPPLLGAVAKSPKRNPSSYAGSIQSKGRGTSISGGLSSVGPDKSTYSSPLHVGQETSESGSIQGVGRGTSLADVAKLIKFPKEEDSVQSVQNEVSEISLGMQNVSIGGIGRGIRRHQNPQAPFRGLGRGFRYRKEESSDKNKTPQ
ncbi:germ-plasm component protein maelstrom isoform X1 [Oratosquilla oratoria]|uniref:germ-plasm component protein maelstrom isoform X1 n=1 Tax=Oratosquilla oratoria TaxID=337810 RepID=UPI003F76F95C